MLPATLGLPNSMTLQFPFSLELDWIGFPSLVVTSWGLHHTYSSSSCEWTWFHSLVSGTFSRWYAIWWACPLLVFLCLNLHAGNCPGGSCFRAEFQQTLPWLTMMTTHQNCKGLPVQCSWCFALEFLYATCLPVITFYVLMLYLSTSLDFFSSLTIIPVISLYLTSACLFPNHNYFQIIVQQLWPISLQLTLPYLFDL